MLTVACVLRSGGDYHPEYVERLWLSCARYLLHRPGVEARFVCLSDTPVPCTRIPLEHKWKGWWAKMELMRPDIKGDILYFDLDTVLVGSLVDLAKVGQLAMLADLVHDARLNSGVMYLPAAARRKAWTIWNKQPRHWMSNFHSGGDGAFLAWVFSKDAARLQDLLPGQIVSYKMHVRPALNGGEMGNGTIPRGARVICFHGRPRPPEVKWLSNEIQARSKRAWHRRVP